jgi:hypothetical protein
MRRRLALTLTCALALACALAPVVRAQTTSSSPASSGVPAGTVLPGEPTASAPASTTTPPATSATPPATSATPASAATSGPASGSSDHKTAILLLAVIGALLLAVAALWGAARWWAYDPPWVDRTRHATAEAGWRTSAAYAEFKDWLRLGR